MSEPNQNKMDSEFYETMDAIQENGDSKCAIWTAFTPNNGIRIGLEDRDNYIEFDFTNAQAELIGQALVRWAQRRRAESELMRCRPHP